MPGAQLGQMQHPAVVNCSSTMSSPGIGPLVIRNHRSGLKKVCTRPRWKCFAGWHEWVRNQQWQWRRSEQLNKFRNFIFLVWSVWLWGSTNCQVNQLSCKYGMNKILLYRKIGYANIRVSNSNCIANCQIIRFKFLKIQHIASLKTSYIEGSLFITNSHTNIEKKQSWKTDTHKMTVCVPNITILHALRFTISASSVAFLASFESLFSVVHFTITQREKGHQESMLSRISQCVKTGPILTIWTHVMKHAPAVGRCTFLDTVLRPSASRLSSTVCTVAFVIEGTLHGFTSHCACKLLFFAHFFSSILSAWSLVANDCPFKITFCVPDAPQLV